jgi:transposase-like protein
MSSPINNGVIPVARDSVRRRALQLYRTTNLGVGAIAKEVGVSRETVYRWLRQEGVPLGRNLIAVGDDMGDLRRDLTILIGQLGRLERLLEAVVQLNLPPDQHLHG